MLYVSFIFLRNQDKIYKSFTDNNTSDKYADISGAALSQMTY